MLETIINNEKNKNIYIEKDWNGGGVGDSARSCPQAPVIHILKLRNCVKQFFVLYLNK